MFRKAPQIKALSNLKSSERRKLLHQIIDRSQLPQNMAKESQDKILPPVTKQTNFITHHGSKGVLYTDETGTPVWFRVSVDMVDQLVPTVYTLWKAPFILPIVRTHPHVIEVLAGGANLMLPGCVPPFDQRAKNGAAVGIADTKDPNLVKAVGICGLNLNTYDKTIGKSGVAVRILHSIDDALFTLAKPKVDQPVELDMEIKFKELEIEEESPIVENDESNDSEAALNDPEVNTINTDKSAIDEELSNNLEKEDEPENSLTTKDIDTIFKRAVMQTLTQTKPQTPMPGSQFMHLVKQNLITSDPYVTVNKTSWKKPGKFLRGMEKANFIKLKGKKDYDLKITSIASTADNKQLRNFVPYKVKKASTTQENNSTQSKNSKGLVLTNYYKPTAPLRHIFNDLDLDFISKYYTKSEIKEVLNAYISKHDLVNPRDKRLILINEGLSKFSNEAALGREKLLPLFTSKFTEYYKLSPPGSTPEDNKAPPVKGALPKVEIITETKIGRKVITRISKIEYFNIDQEAFANELKVKCSGSTTIKPKVENPKFSEISVQGPHFKVVNELLVGKYGLNPNWISFTDKSKPKKKSA